MFFTTQYLQNVHGFGALEAGIWLPVAGGLAIGGPLSTRICAMLGTKLTVASGLAIVSGGLLLYSGADAETGFALIGGSQMILGLGIGLAMAPATDSIMGAVPAARRRRLRHERHRPARRRLARRRRPRLAAGQPLP
jgi:hypothetical protein